MLIVSKEHDYYDAIMRLGVDKSCIYIRRLQEYFQDEEGYKKVYQLIPNKDLKHVGNRYDCGFDNSSDVYIEKIGGIYFCGMYFPFINIIDRKHKKEVFAYSIEEVDRFINTYGSTKDITEYNKRNKSYGIFIPLRRRYVSEIFNVNKNKNETNISFHHIIDSPIVLIENNQCRGNSKIILNPILKAYYFFKVFDPYRTFQEISMFIGGVLGGQTPKMERVSDEIRLEKHGFDRKTSFRKEKG